MPPLLSTGADGQNVVDTTKPIESFDQSWALSCGFGFGALGDLEPY